MKHAYLFAIEFDKWAKFVAREIDQLKETNKNKDLIRNLKDLKTNMSLLAINITGSLGGEDEFIKKIQSYCENIESDECKNLQTDDGMTYQHVCHDIVLLINNYQEERGKKVEDDFNSAIEGFNKLSNKNSFLVQGKRPHGADIFKNNNSEHVGSDVRRKKK